MGVCIRGGVLASVFCLALVSSPGCSCDPPVFVEEGLTGLEIHFEIDGALGVSRIRVAAGPTEDSDAGAIGEILVPQDDTAPLDESESLVVILSDDLGGRELRLLAEGLAAGETVASAQKNVVVVAGEMVRVDFFLGTRLCGDGVCDENEDPCSCPEDCGESVCGDGICCHAAGQNSCNCPADCGESICGDGICCEAAGQDSSNCPEDCGPLLCGAEVCSPNEVCHEGACLPVCVIDGQRVEPFESDQDRSCLICDPGSSTEDWTHECPDHEVCAPGGCISGCSIDDEYFAPHETSAGDPCLICAPEVNAFDWSSAPEDHICDDGNFCTIETMCDAAGECTGGRPRCEDEPCVTSSCNPDEGRCDEVYAPAGEPCGDGRVCDGAGGCADACLIGGEVVPAGTPSPHNPCSVCDPSTSMGDWSPAFIGQPCDDGDFCSTGTSCDAGGNCGDGSPRCVGTGCTISTCNAEEMRCDESDAPVGTDCSDGMICDPWGGCVEACFIDASFVVAMSPKPDNPCRLCIPETSVSDWSSAPASTPCDDGDFCTRDTTCDSNGTCAGGEPTCESTACILSSCNSTEERCEEQPMPAGTDCGDGSICDGAGLCLDGCIHEDDFVAAGSPHPTEPCRVCNPSSGGGQWAIAPLNTTCDDGDYCTLNTTCDGTGDCGNGHEWCVGSVCTDAVCDSGAQTCEYHHEPAGTPCDANMICDGLGGCAEACLVDGGFYQSGEQDPQRDCLVCDPFVSTSDFTDDCGPGMACGPSGCEHGCRIDGVFHPPDTVDPDDPCAACHPSTSISEWSQVAAGSACDDGLFCTMDTLCDASGNCGGGAARCTELTCSITTCTETPPQCHYALVPEGTGCDDGFCDSSGACVEGCFIDGVLYTPGEFDPNGVCGICSPDHSETDWTQVVTFASPVAGTAWTVPTGISEIWVRAWGGGGGGGGGGSAQSAGNGGGGGFARTKLAVSPGSILTVWVGGGGSGGAVISSLVGSGGGGGGFSAISIGDTALLIAGAGGGGGGGDNQSGAPDGGAAGAGGGSTGSAGVGGGGSVDGGGGGTQYTGGAAGGGAGSPTAGALLVGGDGGHLRNDRTAGGTNGGGRGGGGYGAVGRPGGGGGGSGRFGGGGGGAADDGDRSAGGGGGGSSYLTGSEDSTSSGSGRTPGNAGDPLLTGNAGRGGAGGSTGSSGGTGDSGLLIIHYVPICG